MKCPRCGSHNTSRFQWVDNDYWEYWICWRCVGPTTIAGDVVFTVNKGDVVDEDK